MSNNDLKNAAMLAAFKTQAQNVLAKIPHGKSVAAFDKIGAEMEFILYQPHSRALAATSVRDQLIKEMGADADVELGGAQIELHPGPVDLCDGGLLVWKNQLDALTQMLGKLAKAHGLEVGRFGAFPFETHQPIQRTDLEKYHLVPDFHNQRRPWWLNTMVGAADFNDAGVVGLMQSFQFSVQTQNAEHAIDIINRMNMVSPVVTALFANARFVAGKDTGWADVRFEAWRKSHETRNIAEMLQGKQLRVSLPKNHYKNLDDYLADVSSYPFILDKPEYALPVGIGLYWRDARIKFLTTADGNIIPLVEFRPLSMQRTNEECITAAAFVLGRIAWGQANNEPLTAMEKIRSDKRGAERYGTAYLGRPALLREIEKSIDGIARVLHLDTNGVDVIKILLEKANA